MKITPDAITKVIQDGIFQGLIVPTGTDMDSLKNLAMRYYELLKGVEFDVFSRASKSLLSQHDLTKFPTANQFKKACAEYSRPENQVYNEKQLAKGRGKTFNEMMEMPWFREHWKNKALKNPIFRQERKLTLLKRAKKQERGLEDEAAQEEALGLLAGNYNTTMTELELIKELEVTK